MTYIRLTGTDIKGEIHGIHSYILHTSVVHCVHRSYIMYIDNLHTSVGCIAVVH